MLATFAEQAIFETFRVRIGEAGAIVLALPYHFHRMKYACKQRQVNGPTSLLELRSVLRNKTRDAAPGDYRVRVILPPSPAPWELTVHPWVSSTASAGIDVLGINRYRQDPLFKSFKSRPASEDARKAAQEQGFHEALLTTENGEILEGDWSNFFAVIGGTLVTPPLSSGILPGVTRRLIMEFCHTNERRLLLNDVSTMTEAFLTRSMDHIVPLRSINGIQLPSHPFAPRAKYLFHEIQRLTTTPLSLTATSEAGWAFYLI